jgi:hypothetical protein
VFFAVHCTIEERKGIRPEDLCPLLLISFHPKTSGGTPPIVAGIGYHHGNSNDRSHFLQRT